MTKVRLAAFEHGAHSTSLGLKLAALSVMLFAVGAPAEAQNAITPGALNLKSTFDNIGVRADLSGDANQNATPVVRFKKTSEGTWKNAFTPIVDRRASISGHANPYVDEARVSIVGLQSGTSYDVQLTWTDPDGVSGGSTVSGVISTLNTTALTSSEIWVDDSASAGGNGSSATPYNTITAAISAATAGTKIRVRPGSYPAFTMNKSGSASGYIAIVGENRDTTFITGGSVSNNITVGSGVSYVQFKSLRFKATQHNSVMVGSNAHHVWMEDLYHENIMGTGSCSSGQYNDAGVYFSTGTHNGYVINNEFYSAFFTNCNVSGSAWDQNGAAVYMYGTGAEGSFVFKGNTINGGFRDCVGDGGETWGNGFRDNSDIINNNVTGCKDDGIQMEGEDVNLRIGNNFVDANRGYSTLAMAPHLAGPVYVYRNTFYQHGAAGYCGKIYESAQGYAFFIHNTCHAAGGSDGFQGNNNPLNAFYNNIIVSANTCMRSFASTSKSNGNLYQCGSYFQSWGGSSYSSVTAFRSATGNEVNGKQGDPLFLNVSKHIGVNSPAYNGGILLANFNTPDSAWPYSGTAPDIGAFEVGGVQLPLPPGPPEGLRIVP